MEVLATIDTDGLGRVFVRDGAGNVLATIDTAHDPEMIDGLTPRNMSRVHAAVTRILDGGY